MKPTRSIINVLTATAAALLLTTSCNDSYPGLDYEPNPDEQPKNDEDVNIDQTPITLYTNNPAYFSVVSDTRKGIATRGTGTFESKDGEIDNMNRYLAARFHVFAFRAYNYNDPHGGQGALSAEPSMYKSKYATNVPSGYDDPERTSCLLDGVDYKLGMPFKFETDKFVGTIGALVKDNAVYADDILYSDRYQDVGYNFFGYYVDDLDLSNYTRDPDRITYDIAIDGYQDVLVGAAKNLTADDFTADGMYGNAQNLTDEEKEKILSIPGNYSTYAAHRNVNPVVDMKHQLTLLKFSAYAGSSSAKDVTITGISVMSLTKGKLTVASRNLDDCKLEFYPENGIDIVQKALQVGEAGTVSGEEGNYTVSPCVPHLREGGYSVTWKDEWAENQQTATDGKHVPTNEEKKNEAVNIGTGLLVAPQESYLVTLTYTFPDGPNGSLKEHKTEYRITPSKADGEESASFKKGYMYPITIGVYGLEKIQMGGAVSAWGKGEDITIDPDDDPNNPDINPAY